MIKICFVCLGNICRSPMAEFIMKDKVKELNIENEFIIASRATSYEEQGNPMHNGAKKELEINNIPYSNHTATRLEKDDYSKFDYFICMDDSNIRNIKYIFEDKDNKVKKLLDRDVKDPWYTGNFKETYNDLSKGIDNLLKQLI